MSPSSVINSSSTTANTGSANENTMVTSSSSSIPLSSVTNASSTAIRSVDGSNTSALEQGVQVMDGQEHRANKRIQTEANDVSTTTQSSTHVHDTNDGVVAKELETQPGPRGGGETPISGVTQSGLIDNESGVEKAKEGAAVLQQKDTSNDTNTLNEDQLDTEKGRNRAATNQNAQKRAPVIPPLPPCYTTLKTFKSLLSLRPQLQRIASALNPALSGSNAGSQVCQPSTTACPLASSNGVSSRVSSVSRVTCDTRDESRLSRPHLFEEQNGNPLSGNGDSNTQPSNKPSALSGTAVSCGSSRLSVDQDVSDDLAQSNAASQHSGNDETTSRQTQASQTISSNDCPYPQDKEPPEIMNSSKTVPGNPSMHVAIEGAKKTSTAGGGRVENTLTSTPVRAATENKALAAIIGSRLYRNSLEYKMLSSRFNSLFLWPALLSKIPVRFTSQSRPVFAERHPPPKKCNPPRKRRRLATKLVVPTNVAKRKHGLAAVRMASSASFATPAQQLCTVGHGSAIRRDTNSARAPCEAAVEKEVAITAAPQLLSSKDTTTPQPAPVSSRKRPLVSRTCKRKTLPAKRRKTTTSESSSPSAGDDSDDLDFELDEHQSIEPSVVRNTRQNSARTQPAGADATVGDQGNSDITAEMSSGVTKQATVTSASASNVIVISSDSLSDSLRSSLPKKRDDSTGRQSAEMSDHSPEKSSPSSSSKRKTSRPEKNRGARWRAMLPKDASEDSDT